MEIPVGEAQRQLAALIERARAGEEVVLLQNGAPAARLVGVADRDAAQEAARRRRNASIDEVLAGFRAHPVNDGGPDAARSQDWLYGEDGLPG